MTQDHTVHDMVCPQLAKVPTVFVVSKDVMVATYQDLVSVESVHDGQRLSVDDDIAEMVDLVGGSHTLVPQLYHGLVHLPSIVPGAQFGHTVGASKSADSGMSKMCVRN